MPTYEYKCPEGHHFELVQKMSEKPRALCPECGAESERLLSGGAGFLFKGNGFYTTDYRSDSYRKDASKEKSTEESGKADPKKHKKGKDSSPSSTESKKTPSSSSTSGGTPKGGA